ncbi:hypothetical protein ACFPH6_10040 [Streptomyces xiangluensis]|uniref:Uncharacterized protein n=1 Tax=Streptomyces xiangluensis TaxID=2665720 RepID=A0ABV8YM52_9ACTN
MSPTPDERDRIRAAMDRILCCYELPTPRRSPSSRPTSRALVGALHQATTENLHRRRQLADRHAVIRALPTQALLGR